MLEATMYIIAADLPPLRKFLTDFDMSSIRPRWLSHVLHSMKSSLDRSSNVGARGPSDAWQSPRPLLDVVVEVLPPRLSTVRSLRITRFGEDLRTDVGAISRDEEWRNKPLPKLPPAAR